MNPEEQLEALLARVQTLEARHDQMVHGTQDGFDANSEALDTLTREINAVQDVLREAISGKALDNGVRVTDDRLWLCACGSRLGVYSPKEDVMRLRFREQYVSSKVGRGGWIQVTCRNCGRVNREEDSP